MRLSWTFLIPALLSIVRFGHCTTISAFMTILFAYEALYMKKVHWTGIMYLCVFVMFHSDKVQSKENLLCFPDKQYASLPELFYYDNYDNCMSLGDEAFYCLVYYNLEPLDKESPSEIWGLIKNISADEVNYRHDHLRHFICVPTSCPGVKPSHDDDPVLREGLSACFDKKLKQYGVKGTISQLSCDTAKSKYSVDYLDIFAAILFLSCFAFIIYCTVREGFARYGPPEDYVKLEKSVMGKIVLACSITRNWIRLNTINVTPEVEKLRFIQGLRVYNTALVILSHTVLSYITLPVSNPKYVETMKNKYAFIFLSSGPLCVSTFFFISAFLLANGIFSYCKDKKMNLKTIGFITANRIFRLSPTVFVVVLFHATLMRHLGDGPNWNKVMGDESQRCRNKGWSNVFFINNLDPYNMCLPTTWYLALDTQYFIISLFFIWMIKSYEKHAYYIFGSITSMTIVASFVQNYYYGFTALDIPLAEKYFDLKHILKDEQFHYQLCSFIGNFIPTSLGLMFGYFFHKHKNEKIMIFNSKCRQIVWWIITWGIGLGIVVFPGYVFLNCNIEINRFWASVFVALSRPLFTFALGVGYFGVMDGIGWFTKTALEWRPTYILGRLTFSAYLVHMSLIIIRPALARHPIYISDFIIVSSFLGDMALVFLVAAILTLFLELPLSELQKMVFGLKQKEEKSEENSKDK